jgi:zinc transporter 9
MVEADRTTNGWIDRQHRALTSEPMGTTLLIAVIVLVLSLLGGYAPRALAGRLTNTRLEDMTGIASGLLLTSALLLVVPEGFHVAAEAAHEAGLDEVFVFAPVTLGFTVLLGFVVMLLLEGFGIGHAVHEEHHDHAEGHGHAHVHHPTSPAVLALGLSVHAVADGIAIGAAAATGESSFSLLVAVAVILHRVPAAFSLGVFALHESGSRGHRELLMFAVATPFATVLSFQLLDQASEKLVALALLFSAGTFLYVATVDTLPAIHNPETGRRSVRNIVIGGVIFGVLLLILQRTGLLEHSH